MYLDVYTQTGKTDAFGRDRSFSIFKRSKLSDSYLEDFMLMAVEKTNLNNIYTDKIIERLKNKSTF